MSFRRVIDVRDAGPCGGSARTANPLNRLAESVRLEVDAEDAGRGYRGLMTVQRPSPTDVGLGLALVVGAQIELWLRADAGTRAVLLALLGTAPVVVRSVAPRVALGGCVLAMVGVSALQVIEFTVAELLALMLVTYTVALLERRMPAVAGLVVVIAAALANSAASGSREDGDYIFPLILLGVPWAAGRALRRWRERTEELRAVTAQLREERERHAELAVAAERGRIARELHDSLAQSLNAVVVHSEVAEESLGRDDARVASSLGRIGSVARSSLAETRQLLDALRDQADGDSPRLDELTTLVEERSQDGLAVDLVVDGDADGLSATVEAAVFRIVQESLTNVALHSASRRARVRVCLGHEVLVRVEDDGPAVRGASSSQGLGLLGMRERAALLGGTFRAGAHEGGFVVEAAIPRGVPS